jgi:hypothetical protein
MNDSSLKDVPDTFSNVLQKKRAPTIQYGAAIFFKEKIASERPSRKTFYILAISRPLVQKFAVHDALKTCFTVRDPRLVQFSRRSQSFWLEPIHRLMLPVQVA